jgi:RNA polymerase sigma factor FliA
MFMCALNVSSDFKGTSNTHLDTLLLQYRPLVKRLAQKMMARLPFNVEVDDLIQVGMLGLADAITRFDETQGVQLEAFATQRIKGAMLDELRQNDHLSRGVRSQQRAVNLVTQKLEHELGRRPKDSEIAQALGLSLTQYRELCAAKQGTQLVHLEDLGSNLEGRSDFLDFHLGDESFNPAEQLQDRRMRQALIEAIKTLPAREQKIMSLYYEQDMNLREIALLLGVTESRICQMHTQSVVRLRTKMRAH